MTKENCRTAREDDILPYEDKTNRRAFFCLPPGGRGTTKWWKEQAGTRAENRLLLRADMESAPTEIRSTIRIDRNTESVGSRQFAGRGGACSSRISGQLKTCGEVTKEQLQLLKNRSPRVTAHDFVMIPDHIHAMIFFYEKAGGAMPFVANGIAPPLPSSKRDRAAVGGGRRKRNFSRNHA